MTPNPHQSGFSAVELLITLFIGFLFVMMGYQLYAVSIQSSQESREIGKGSNLAYEQIRKVQLTKIPAGTPCVITPTTLSSVSVDNDAAMMTTKYSCPHPSILPDLRLVTVTVKYNLSQQEVTHALYISQI